MVRLGKQYPTRLKWRGAIGMINMGDIFHVEKKILIKEEKR